jgi:hypothetical protein
LVQAIVKGFGGRAIWSHDPVTGSSVPTPALQQQAADHMVMKPCRRLSLDSMDLGRMATQHIMARGFQVAVLARDARLHSEMWMCKGSIQPKTQILWL